MSLNACVAKPEIKTPLDADMLYLTLGTAEPFDVKPPEVINASLNVVVEVPESLTPLNAETL